MNRAKLIGQAILLSPLILLLFLMVLGISTVLSVLDIFEKVRPKSKEHPWDLGTR